MAITYTATVRRNLLVVKAAGSAERAAEIQVFDLALIKESERLGVACVLLDQARLEFSRSALDEYQGVVFLAGYIPYARRTAVVCKANDISGLSFWEKDAVNRGQQVRTFKDIHAALAWLKTP